MRYNAKLLPQILALVGFAGGSEGQKACQDVAVRRRPWYVPSLVRGVSALRVVLAQWSTGCYIAYWAYIRLPTVTLFSVMVLCGSAVEEHNKGSFAWLLWALQKASGRSSFKSSRRVWDVSCTAAATSLQECILVLHVYPCTALKQWELFCVLLLYVQIVEDDLLVVCL